MEGAYDSYARSPPAPARGSGRDRDDYRSSDPYRDRRRSPDRRRVDRDRDRRRSRSPAQIDRYQPDRVPRDDYYNSRGRDDMHRERDRRRSSPQPASIDRYVPGMPEPTSPAMLVNPLPDPIKLDFQVGFTWFAEWWRTEQRIKEEKERQRAGRPPPRLKGERETREEREAERPKIQAAYDQYKENLQKQQAQTFVRLHKAEDWFRERYVPETRDPFRTRLMNFRRGLFDQWERDLQAGTFDDFTLEGIYKSEFNGSGGVLEKEDGETTAAAEVLGVGDLLPSKGGDLRDPASDQPTLLIKTIAPTVTRERFEAFAKEHLGEAEGGYQHLSLSDPNPLKKCHRMGWIMLNPDLEQQAEGMDTRPDREHGEEGEADGMVSTTSASEKALEKINGKTIEDPERGNFTVHCGVHRPPEQPRKKALWDLFSAPERIARDLELATRLVRKLDNELGDAYFGVAKIEERVQDLAERGLLEPTTVSSQPLQSMDASMDEDGEIEEDEGLVDEDETDDSELIIKKKKLDLLVEYLRRVYNFCFFCVFESDSVHELQRKCPGGHLRRPRSSLTSAAKAVAKASAIGEAFPLKKPGRSDATDRKDNGESATAEDAELTLDMESPVEEKKTSMLKPSHKNAMQLQRAFNWVKTFEEKVLQILEPSNVNIRKLGGAPLEEGLEEELGKFVKQEDINKYRCKAPECIKLFKGVDFWRKHVEKRHAEWYDSIRNDIELVNTYVLDPSHIAPSRSDANSNGHFPLGNNVPTGTPRGFQLTQHLPYAGFGMHLSNNGMPPAIMPAIGMPFAGPNLNMIPGMAGGIGPIRTHGGRGPMSTGRMPGPYARNDGRSRMGGMRNGLPGAGGLSEGGITAMGPQEAVQGRALRSYEDLDAAGDTGANAAAEMDY